MIVRDKVTRPDIEQVVASMRARDEEEIFALRWDDSHTSLIDNIEAAAGAMWNAWRWQNECIAITGVMPIRPGVAQACALGTARFRYAVRPIIRRAWLFDIPALQAGGFHRGEAYVLARNTDSRDFLEAIGGRVEAYLHQYGRNCEDYVLYSWRLNDVLQRRRGRRASVSILSEQPRPVRGRGSWIAAGCH